MDLEDQFGVTEAIKVSRRPALFCSPVDKNGEGISAPQGHLTCYYVGRGGKSEVEVTVNNQFSEEKIFRLIKFRLLCVPSEKVNVEPVDPHMKR